eukprot:6204922-Pleurochrysis_carterae.AAC.1
MGAVETCDEIEARVHDGPIMDGRSARQFARQNCGGVNFGDFRLSLACCACLPFSLLCGLVWYRIQFIFDDKPTRGHTDGAHTRERAVESALESAR